MCEIRPFFKEQCDKSSDFFLHYLEAKLGEESKRQREYFEYFDNLVIRSLTESPGNGIINLINKSTVSEINTTDMKRK